MIQSSDRSKILLVPDFERCDFAKFSSYIRMISSVEDLGILAKRVQ